MKCSVDNCPARFFACEDAEKAAYGDLELLDKEIKQRLGLVVTARDANPGVCFFDEETRTKRGGDGKKMIDQNTSVILCSSLQHVGMETFDFGGAHEKWRLFYLPHGKTGKDLKGFRR